MRFPILAALLFLLPLSVQAAEDKPLKTFTGKPIVLDGDTLMFGKTRFRLLGISAPEMSELNGWYSRAIVDKILKGHSEITCHQINTDRYKRPVGVCIFEKDGKHYDLGIAIVQNGAASVHRLYSRTKNPIYGEGYGDYLDLTEYLAQVARDGFWGQLPKLIDPELVGAAIDFSKIPLNNAAN